jgi:hypothetical protein
MDRPLFKSGLRRVNDREKLYQNYQLLGILTAAGSGRNSTVSILKMAVFTLEYGGSDQAVQL